MKIHEKYLEALKTFDDFVTVSEWAVRFSEMYPELLDKANKEAQNQKNDTTGLRELAARISSRLATGGFDGLVEIDATERPRKVKYITKEELNEKTTQELEEDIEPLRRQDIINQAKESLEAKELYRISEFENIQKSFKSFFGIDFEIDHAQALLDDAKQGKHHPDNFQLLLKYHNVKKYKNSWQRFSIEEQITYIYKVVELHKILEDKLGVKLDTAILDNLLSRLKAVY